MRLSKAQTQSRVHAIPQIRFEQQRLTSFAGLVLFQLLFKRLDLKARLAQCFRSVAGQAWGAHGLFLQLVVHILMGFRSLPERDHYCNDPMVQRLLGVKRLADVSTLSRRLSQVQPSEEQKVRELNRQMVLDRLKAQGLARVTLDFDGSVMSTRRHAEGTAVGFNKKRKGERSYYPLFCTVPQTGQFLDFHHRSGNVHDSNGAGPFMQQCLDAVQQVLPRAVYEARMDSAFFDEKLLLQWDASGVQFSVSVPFERFPLLKRLVQQVTQWHPIDAEWSFVEADWRPQCWSAHFRILLLRRRSLRQRKGPLQLDLFVPREHDYEYKVVATNKQAQAQTVLLFHNGRGGQEALLGEAKSACALEYIPMRRRVGNQLFTGAALMAHNLCRELQMQAKPGEIRSGAKRSALWDFETLDRLRSRLIQRAGRFTAPQGVLTLTMSANPDAQRDIRGYLDALALAA